MFCPLHSYLNFFFPVFYAICHGFQTAANALFLSHSERFHRMPDGPMKELVSFVFWTCLQLERYVTLLVSQKHRL